MLTRILSFTSPATNATCAPSVRKARAADDWYEPSCDVTTIQFPSIVTLERSAALKRATLSERFIGELSIPERRLGSAPAFTSLAATSNVESLASRKCFVSTKRAAIKAGPSTLSGSSLDASDNRYRHSL